jgi:hypothetical protein
MSRRALLLIALLAGCHSSSADRDASPGPDQLVKDQLVKDAARLDAHTAGEAGTAREAGGTSKAKDCASTFGTELTNAFGRIDGTLLAVVAPQDTQCAQPNDDHLIVQVMMNQKAYRMVVNVLSSGADTKVRFAEVEHALPGPAWSEGWHAGAVLDYVSTLAVHSTVGFTPYEMSALITQVSDRLTLGAPISVYATSAGGTKADSAHLVHRNATNKDGAIVVDPKGATPHFLLFHFPDQTF